MLPERIFSLGEGVDGEIYLIGGPDPRSPFVPDRPSLAIRLAPAPHTPALGDLNDDGMFNGADWTLFKAGQGSNFTGLTVLQARAKGDLDGDFDHDLNDYVVFRTIYEDHTGPARSPGCCPRCPSRVQFRWPLLRASAVPWLVVGAAGSIRRKRPAVGSNSRWCEAAAKPLPRAADSWSGLIGFGGVR